MATRSGCRAAPTTIRSRTCWPPRQQGISTRELVNRNASAFAGLREHLSLSFDDFIRTSSDPRHRPGVERLWRACAASGDLYRKTYEGLYCVGCEQFYTEAELDDGNCPDHGTPPQVVAEENWFFRLSKYADRLREEISSGRLRIEPASRRNEVLGFIAGGLEDFSASRSVARARGWGIEVPGDPSQVIYVWWDALGNYITSLNYGSPGERSAEYQRWWAGADRRTHVVGKGVLRFHAVYWPAILLSAGEPLPTEIFVHDYLTVDGRKISKSAATGSAATAVTPLRSPAPTAPTRCAGGCCATCRGSGTPTSPSTSWSPGPTRTSPTAWATWSTGWCRSFIPTGTGPSDRAPRLRARAAGWRQRLDLTTAALRTGQPMRPRCGQTIERTPEAVRTALARFDFRTAAAAVFEIVEQANRYVEAAAPWQLARAERAGDTAAGERLDQVLGALVAACQVLASEIWPFVPDLAARVAAACHDFGGTLPKPRPVFPRIDAAGLEAAETVVASLSARRAKVSEVA